MKKSNHMLGFKVIKSTLGGNYNLGVTCNSQEVTSRSLWQIVGFYTSRAPLSIEQFTVMGPSFEPVELLPYEWAQRTKILPDKILLPSSLKVQAGQIGIDLGFMCNESLWPNALFAPKLHTGNKKGADSSNIFVYASADKIPEEEIFVSYSGVFEKNTKHNNLMLSRFPSTREIDYYIEWLESGLFHFDSGGILEPFLNMTKVLSDDEKLANTMKNAKTKDEKESIIQLYLNMQLKYVRVKNLLTCTWLNLYLHKYFHRLKRTDILETLSRLHGLNLQPWESCLKADQAAISRLKALPSYSKLISEKRFSELNNQIFSICSAYKNFQASSLCNDVIFNLNKTRTQLAYLHPTILLLDRKEDLLKKSVFLLRLLDCIYDSISAGRYDSRAYSIALIELIKNICLQFPGKSKAATKITEKCDLCLRSMADSNFKETEIAKHIAYEIRKSHDDTNPVTAFNRLNAAVISHKLKQNSDDLPLSKLSQFNLPKDPDDNLTKKPHSSYQKTDTEKKTKLMSKGFLLSSHEDSGAKHKTKPKDLPSDTTTTQSSTNKDHPSALDAIDKSLAKLSREETEKISQNSSNTTANIANGNEVSKQADIENTGKGFEKPDRVVKKTKPKEKKTSKKDSTFEFKRGFLG